MKICFVAHLAYGALTNDSSRHVGGVESQSALMSKWLARAGHDVSVITWAEGPQNDEVIDGVRVLKACASDAGIPGLRFFYPRWSSLVNAMRRADADLYYQNCAESVTGQVALWARRNQRKFVYSVASDPECDPKLPILPAVRERVLYKYGLTHADLVLVQTAAQRNALADGFGLASVVQKMPCVVEADADVERALRRRCSSPRVLWLGRFAPVKNLDRLFDVAEMLPNVQFDVVGGEDKDTEYAHRVTQRGNKIANVNLHGRLSVGEIQPLLAQSWMLLSTSDYEGFPNTFLEAWAHARPVVSTVDPDGLLAELEIGVVGDDVQALARAIEDYVADRMRLDCASANAQKYYVEYHALDQAMGRFEAQFSNVLQAGS